MDAHEEQGGSAMRLQKFLARAGVGSRRRCEEIISSGRVRVNGLPASEMGIQVDPLVDQVTLDDALVTLPTETKVLLLNKPAGCYTTMRDEEGRWCVADLLPLERYPGLYHIGRLDRDTTGVLLFTSAGSLGNDLLHPSKHVAKEYLAQVEGTPTERDLDRIRRGGLVIRRGEKRHVCAPAEADLLRKLPNRYRQQDSCLEPGLPGTSIVRLGVHEGITHQVKLMLGAIGHKVVRLHRTQFGPVALGALQAGKWRELDADETAALYH